MNNNTSPIFRNPILSGFHPDPTICRVQEDYYLVTSTFEYFPGLPIFHSRDLVHWQQIGHVMNRPSQLPLQNAQCSGGLFAPTLRYHNGIFYLICTNISDKGNFVVTATNPAGPWSEPHYIANAPGIDPSLFFDTDGRCWWTGNGNPEISLYEGHHTIWLQEFDYTNFCLLGTPQVIVNGGSDIRREPIWIEGPHLYKIKEYYYLFAAEGGTGENHSEVVFRSRMVTGPYESFSANPFLTNRDLAPTRPNPITCTGHADLVETQNGEWWMVLLACRPYPPGEEGMTNLGRETFLVPLTWQNDWPQVAGGIVAPEYAVPNLPQTDTVSTSFYGGDVWQDDFTSTELNLSWCHIRTPDFNRPIYNLTERPGFLRLELRPETLHPVASPAFLGVRQRHHTFTATIQLDFTPHNVSETAGITFFYSNEAFYTLAIGWNHAQQRCVRLQKCHGQTIETVSEALLSTKTPLELRIVGKGGQCAFAYRELSQDVFTEVPHNHHQDAMILNSKRSGGFVGAFIGLFATSNGTQSNNVSDFQNFLYVGE